ncbi:MAG: caspase family protein [Rhodocyclaceae bacterium]|nr:caspase family protein [Rhodocyclaceae bacterium]
MTQPISKASTSKAFLVGINRYKTPGSDLQGCVNDVTNLRDILLKYFGFTVKNIRVLTDARATKAAILTRIDWLIKDAKAGDRLLFHFSGHGSQIRDRDGDELKDQLDEIICPHDMDWDGTFITDDDLRDRFATLPKGVNLEVLLDSCHSGTGTRNQPTPFSPPSPACGGEGVGYPNPRFLIPPVDIACRAEGEEEDLPKRNMLKGTSKPIMGITGHVLFAGCRDNQTSADAYINGSYNGAFTYYLCKHLRETQGNITRADLIKRLRASIKFNGYSQVPQLETTAAERKKRVLE